MNNITITTQTITGQHTKYVLLKELSCAIYHACEISIDGIRFGILSQRGLAKVQCEIVRYLLENFSYQDSEESFQRYVSKSLEKRFIEAPVKSRFEIIENIERYLSGEITTQQLNYIHQWFGSSPGYYDTLMIYKIINRIRIQQVYSDEASPFSDGMRMVPDELKEKEVLRQGQYILDFIKKDSLYWV